jgi:glycosyltransferase involved in cell wall biosynthesis
MLWSILVAGIPERFHTVQPLLLSLLETQAVSRMPDVELLYLMDSKRRPVGAKRNDLLAAARGTYLSFIDDDDTVADDYVRRIYRTILESRKAKTPPDVICFRQTAIIGATGITHDCHYSLASYKSQPPEQRRVLATAHDKSGVLLPNVLRWSGPPAHTMVWRRELVASIRFPEKTFGEDVAWVDLACERATTEIQLDGEPLYTYRFDPERSATR